MSLISKQSGFSAVELVIVLAVVGVLGFVGYSVYSRQQVKTAGNSSLVAEQSPTADVPQAPEIKSSSDLATAEKMLEGTNVKNSADSSQLDTELASF